MASHCGYAGQARVEVSIVRAFPGESPQRTRRTGERHLIKVGGYIQQEPMGAAYSAAARWISRPVGLTEAAIRSS